MRLRIEFFERRAQKVPGRESIINSIQKKDILLVKDATRPYILRRPSLIQAVAGRHSINVTKAPSLLIQIFPGGCVESKLFALNAMVIWVMFLKGSGSQIQINGIV